MPKLQTLLTEQQFCNCGPSNTNHDRKALHDTHIDCVLLLYYPLKHQISRFEISITKNWGPQLLFGPSKCA